MFPHWFLNPGQNRFRDSLISIFNDASSDMCRLDSRRTLGDEHDQCQYLFTNSPYAINRVGLNSCKAA